MVAAKLRSADHFWDCVSSVEVGPAGANPETPTWALCRTVRLLPSYIVSSISGMVSVEK
jgi:hypothetical protein